MDSHENSSWFDELMTAENYVSAFVKKDDSVGIVVGGDMKQAMNLLSIAIGEVVYRVYGDSKDLVDMQIVACFQTAFNAIEEAKKR